MWPTNYELDNAYANVSSVYSQQLYSNKHISSSIHQLNNSHHLNNLSTNNQFHDSDNSDLTRCQTNSPKSQLPTRIQNSLNNNSFWSNYTSYSNYNQIAAAVAAVQTVVANSGANDSSTTSNHLQTYPTSNLINNSTNNNDSFRTRPNSLETTTNFYNTSCLDLPSTPGRRIFGFIFSLYFS